MGHGSGFAEWRTWRRGISRTRWHPAYASRARVAFGRPPARRLEAVVRWAERCRSGSKLELRIGKAIARITSTESQKGEGESARVSCSGSQLFHPAQQAIELERDGPPKISSKRSPYNTAVREPNVNLMTAGMCPEEGSGSMTWADGHFEPDSAESRCAPRVWQ